MLKYLGKKSYNICNLCTELGELYLWESQIEQQMMNLEEYIVHCTIFAFFLQVRNFKKLNITINLQKGRSNHSFHPSTTTFCIRQRKK